MMMTTMQHAMDAGVGPGLTRGEGPVGTVIVVRKSGRDGGRFPLEKGTAIIGRLESCDIRIALPYVSRKHAELRVEDGKVTLTNFSNVNPTMVNGEALVPEEGEAPTAHVSVVLYHNDTFMVADRAFRFEYEEAATAAKMTRPSPEDEEVMPEGCHTGGVSLASGDKENVAGKGGVVAMTPGSKGATGKGLAPSSARRSPAQPLQPSRLTNVQLSASPAPAAGSVSKPPQQQAHRLGTPLRQAIDSRRQSYAEPPPPQPKAPTPLRQQINARRQSYAEPQQPQPKLATPMRQAINARRQSYSKPPQQQPKLATPMRQAIHARRQSYSEPPPPPPPPQQQQQQQAAARLATPLRQAIDSRRQSYAEPPPPQPKAPTPLRQQINARRRQTVEPAAVAAAAMPTPLKREIQARRQSYGPTPASSVPAVEVVEETEALAYEYEYYEEDEAAADAFATQRNLGVTPAGPKPARRAVVPGTDHEDASEAQCNLGVTPAGRRAKGGRKPAALPTPMRAAIHARRLSVAGEEVPAAAATASTTPVASRRGLPTPVRQAITARRQSYGTPLGEAARVAVAAEAEPVYYAADDEAEEEDDAFAMQRGLGITPAGPKPPRRAVMPGMDAEDAFTAQRALGLTPAGPKPVRRAVVPGMDHENAFEAQRNLGVTPAGPKPARRALVPGMDHDDAFEAQRNLGLTPAAPKPARRVIIAGHEQEDAFEVQRALELTPAAPKPPRRAVVRGMEQEDAFAAQRGMGVTPAGPKPARRAVVPGMQQEDAFEAQRGIGVTPVAPRVKPARRTLPTPVRQAIDGRRQSYSVAGAAPETQQLEEPYDEATEEDDDGEEEDVIALGASGTGSALAFVRRLSVEGRMSVGGVAAPAMDGRKLPTPLRQAISARRQSYTMAAAVAAQRHAVVPEEGVEEREGVGDEEQEEEDAFAAQRQMAVTPALPAAKRALARAADYGAGQARVLRPGERDGRTSGVAAELQREADSLDDDEEEEMEAATGTDNSTSFEVNNGSLTAEGLFERPAEAPFALPPTPMLETSPASIHAQLSAGRTSTTGSHRLSGIATGSAARRGSMASTGSSSMMRRDRVVRRQSFATEAEHVQEEEKADAFAAQRGIGVTPAPRRPVRRAVVPGQEADDAFAAHRALGVTPAGPKPPRRALLPGTDADDAFAAQRGMAVTPAVPRSVRRPVVRGVELEDAFEMQRAIGVTPAGPRIRFDGTPSKAAATAAQHQHQQHQHQHQQGEPEDEPEEDAFAMQRGLGVTPAPAKPARRAVVPGMDAEDAFTAQRNLGVTPAGPKPARRTVVHGMEQEDAFAAQRGMGVTPAGPKPARRALVPGMDHDDAFEAQRLGLAVTPSLAPRGRRPGPPRAPAVHATMAAARVPLPPSTGKGKVERRRSLLEELGQPTRIEEDSPAKQQQQQAEEGDAQGAAAALAAEMEAVVKQEGDKAAGLAARPELCADLEMVAAAARQLEAEAGGALSPSAAYEVVMDHYLTDPEGFRREQEEAPAAEDDEAADGASSNDNNNGGAFLSMLDYLKQQAPQQQQQQQQQENEPAAVPRSSSTTGLAKPMPARATTAKASALASALVASKGEQQGEAAAAMAEDDLRLVEMYAKEMAEAGGVSADYATQVALDTYLADRQGFRAHMASLVEEGAANANATTKPEEEKSAPAAASSATKRATRGGQADQAVEAAPAAPKEEGEEEEEEEEGSDYESVLAILCDGCDGEFPLEDLGLAAVPEGDWYCPTCRPPLPAAAPAQPAAAPTPARPTRGRRAAANAPTKEEAAAVPARGRRAGAQPARATRAAEQEEEEEAAVRRTTRRNGTAAAAPAPATRSTRSSRR